MLYQMTSCCVSLVLVVGSNWREPWKIGTPENFAEHLEGKPNTDQNCGVICSLYQTSRLALSHRSVPACLGVLVLS